MNASPFESKWTSKKTLPVRRVGDRWEFFYGGDLPVEDGALAEIALDAASITDKDFRKRVTSSYRVKVLSEGTELLVALSDPDPERQRASHGRTPFPAGAPPGTTRFERVSLGPSRKAVSRPLPRVDLEPGGLWLKLKGLERCELQSGSVLMPQGFEPSTATSLNHAFTMLSRAYETHRISNTGNVYTRCFYQDADERWYPLNDLRTGVQAIGERELLRATWVKVEQLLGWRPVGPTPRRKPSTR